MTNGAPPPTDAVDKGKTLPRAAEGEDVEDQLSTPSTITPLQRPIDRSNVGVDASMERPGTAEAGVVTGTFVMTSTRVCDAGSGKDLVIFDGSYEREKSKEG